MALVVRSAISWELLKLLRERTVFGVGLQGSSRTKNLHIDRYGQIS
jgi:hypothetical protein